MFSLYLFRYPSFSYLPRNKNREREREKGKVGFFLEGGLSLARLREGVTKVGWGSERAGGSSFTAWFWPVVCTCVCTCVCMYVCMYVHTCCQAYRLISPFFFYWVNGWVYEHARAIRCPDCFLLLLFVLSLCLSLDPCPCLSRSAEEIHKHGTWKEGKRGFVRNGKFYPERDQPRCKVMCERLFSGAFDWGK
jgi:hypothetical protein